MKNRTVTIAGEPVEDLEAALDALSIESLPCGCLEFSGILPKLLSQSLDRALKTIDAQISELAEDEPLDDEAMDPMRELLLRLGHTQRARS